SETVWRQADRYRIPRLAFVNKCDREGADPARVMEQMRARLGAVPVAIGVAIGVGASVHSVVGLIPERGRTGGRAGSGAAFQDGPIPHGQMQAASVAREQMIEAIAELDDELMAAWVAGRELAPGAIHAALRRVTLACRGVPTLFGAAFRNQGIHNL